MFVQGLPFLIGVAITLSYILCELLKGRSYGVVKDMLFGFGERLKANGFVVKTILFDGEDAVAKIKGDLAREGIDLNPTPREHVPVVENRIKTVKERVRGLIAILPFVLCLTFLVYAVKHVVTMVNKAPSETMSEFIAPITALTGRPVHVDDIRLPFLQYVEVHERGTRVQNSVTNARTRSCLALYPRDNLQHSWYFYFLDKGTLIARDRYTVVPMPGHVVRMMQQMATTMKTVNLEDEHPEDESEENTDPMDNLGHSLASAPVDPVNNLDYALSRMEPIEDDRPTSSVNPTGIGYISDPQCRELTSKIRPKICNAQRIRYYRQLKEWEWKISHHLTI
jgi:hypothetical protein